MFVKDLLRYKSFFYAIIQEKKVVQNKMENLFKEIYENETNERTAFILMLSTLSQKLTDIAFEIEKSNKVLTEILLSITTAKDGSKKQIKTKTELLPEDYME